MRKVTEAVTDQEYGDDGGMGGAGVREVRGGEASHTNR